MTEFATLFKDFGYPALMSGVLLYLLTVKLEKVSVKLTEMNALLTSLRMEMLRLRARAKLTEEGESD